MRNTISWHGRLFILTLGSVLWLGLAGSWLAAQNAPRTPPKEEQEDPVKPKRKTPPRVEDEVPTRERPKLPASSAMSGPNDLARAAERTRNPTARQLFLDLSIPHDIVRYHSGRTVKVEPVARFVDREKAPLVGILKLHPFDSEWKRRDAFDVTSQYVESITPYERHALSLLAAFLEKGAEASPGTDPESALARLDWLHEAERALAAVINFHDSARTRGLREESEGWRGLEMKLREKLREIQLSQLRALGQAGEWEEAIALSSQLKGKYPKQEEVLVEIAKMLARHAEHSLKKGDLDAARLQLQLLEDNDWSMKIAEPLKKELIALARPLFDDGMKLRREGKTVEAMAKFEAAEKAYPQLPGLRDAILQLRNDYPVLYVGVRHLPEHMSPATAFTDPEIQAVELLFESLVQPVYDPARGAHHAPELAAGVPRLVPHGRLFQLSRQAYWSDETPVTATDVSRTVQLLKAEDWPGRNRAWGELIDSARPDVDPYHVRLALSQGYLDPLALMTFKILPYSANLSRADSLNFAKKPIGSGPFQYMGRKEGRYAVFTANPYYGARPGKTGLPRIREIWFLRSDDPVTDYLSGKLHLLLDIPTKLYKVLSSAGIPVVTLTEKLPNRRIYFLAVNHRVSALAKPEVRRALAFALDREAILDGCFREDAGMFHRPLNGPYPPDSWAYSKHVSDADPCKPELAKTLAEKARVGQLKLTLKYPEGDAQVEKAGLMIKDQVEKATGIQIDPVALRPRDLRQAVEETHEYELAYYHHDYAGEDYRLWPLFNPQGAGAGGRNYLGYQNDGQLVSRFRKAQSHREFAVVQRLTHQIHQHLFDQMPLIPLWQLDVHVAIHPHLKPSKMDPLLIFNDVEKWTLETKR